MQKIYTGINENNGDKVSFLYSEMCEMGFTSEFMIDPQNLAHILACNTEYPTVREDGTVAIYRRNFSDSFADMMADLRGEDDDWDDDWDGEYEEDEDD